MTPAILTALAKLADLSAEQQHGVVDALAKLQPHLLVEMAARQKLGKGVAAHMVAAAPSYVLADLLDQLPADSALLEAAVEAHGAEPDLVVLCGRRGWLDKAVDLAARVESEQVERVTNKWARMIDKPLPSQLRAALIRAALNDTGPHPKISGMPSWERDEAVKRLKAKREAMASQAWRLLESAPELWVELICDTEVGPQVQDILLNRASELSDEVLLACLPAITNEHIRERDGSASSIMAMVRLELAAAQVRRWLRLRELVPHELQRVIREAVEDGWTPGGRGDRSPDWKAITALAELTEDPAMLAEAAVALRAENPWIGDRSWPPSRNDRDRVATWNTERAEAASALASNPFTPVDLMTEALNSLDEEALEGIAALGGGSVPEVGRQRLADLRHAAAAAQERDLVRIPSDDELAHRPDPAAELRKYLRDLRGPAARRDAVGQALVRSRFATPDILRTIPARLVLDSNEQAGQVAAMIAEACGDDSRRWADLLAQYEKEPGRTVTFGAWLDGMKTEP